MQTATAAVELVEQHYEIALAIARQWGRRWKQFAADFESAAGLTLWKCATAWNPDRASFRYYLRKQLRFAMLDVIREAGPPLPQFVPSPDDDAHPLHGVRSREPDPAQAVELLDAPLLLAKVPEHRRADFMRWLEGTPSNTRGADQEIAPAAARQRVYHDMRRLRELVGADDD